MDQARWPLLTGKRAIGLAREEPVPLAGVFLLFFGSGVCALVYETVWVRQLVLSFGITIYAISAVLAAYMFGLSLGAAWIGRRAPRTANPLRLYAWFECGIAIYALALHFVLADVMPQVARVVHVALPGAPAVIHLVRFIFAFVLLAAPTTLMGGTLPLLGQLVARGAERAGARIGWLYGLNTLGAVAGTGLAGFWMLKNLGLFETTAVAVVANLAIAALALRLSYRVEPASPAVPAGPTAASTSTGPRDAKVRAPAPRHLVGAVAFLTGFAALSYELMWNRTLLFYIHNSTYAFSMILMLFLLGVGLGSLAYAYRARAKPSLHALGIVQILLALSVWASIHVTGLLPRFLSRLTYAVGTDSWAAALVNIAAATSLVVLAPTFLMGLSFPMAAALYAPGEADVGTRLGGLYALNTLGNILGSLVTGFVLIGTLGLRDSFAVGIACNLLAGFACLLWHRQARGRLVLAGALAAAGVVVFLMVVERDTFRRYYERTASKVLFYKEEVTDTVIVVEGPSGHRQIRYSDGRGTAGTNTDFTNRLYGHIPMLLHPAPEAVLSIAFGVGNTLSALAQWEPRRLVCVELSPGVLETAKYFWTNRQVLKTPGLDVRIDDGRNFLLMSDERFDIVQLEPPEIHTAGVVNLYTREFYELVRHDLKPGGILAQWMNVILMPEHEMRMLAHTMQEVFPHTSLWAGAAWWDLILVGSMEPIRVDPERMAAHLARPGVRADLERLGLRGAEAVLAHHVLGPASLRAYVSAAPIVTDNRTYVDFSVPQSREAGFGLFLYQTQQDVPRARSPERIRQRLTLLANRESPLYLLDLGTLPTAERTRIESAIEVEVDRQRQQGRLELARR